MKSIPLKFAAIELLGLGLHDGVPVMPADGRALRIAEFKTHTRFFPVEETPSVAGFEPMETSAAILSAFRKFHCEAP